MMDVLIGMAVFIYTVFLTSHGNELIVAVCISCNCTGGNRCMPLLSTGQSCGRRQADLWYDDAIMATWAWE